MIVSRSSGWLSRHGKPLLRSYEWHPAVVSPSISLPCSFFLSLFRLRLPHREAASEMERVGEGKDGDREDKRRDRDAYNYLSFYIRELGRLPQAHRSFSSFRIHSLIFSTLLPFFLPPSSPFTLFHSARSLARAVSLFAFLSSSFFFLALSPLLLMKPTMRSRTSARVTNANTNGRIDGRTRAHAYRKAEMKCTRVNERVK